MKKFELWWIAIGVTMLAMFFLYTPANAGPFNFGSTTYEQADDILIVNSLGDQVAESTFGDLGYNDYIPENAFKNDLYNQGYTKVFDSMPTDVTEVVEVGYMGLKGDPRAYDADYVLKSEYDRLSAPQQAVRMDGMDSRMNDMDSRMDNMDSRLTDLQQLQVKAELRLMLYEAKNYKVETYYKQTLSGGSGNETGVCLTWNIGKTYAQKQAEAYARHIERIEKRLAAMERR